jgi:hypothetical protein
MNKIINPTDFQYQYEDENNPGSTKKTYLTYEFPNPKTRNLLLCYDENLVIVQQDKLNLNFLKQEIRNQVTNSKHSRSQRSRFVMLQSIFPKPKNFIK